MKYIRNYAWDIARFYSHRIPAKATLAKINRSISNVTSGKAGSVVYKCTYIYRQYLKNNSCMSHDIDQGRAVS